MIVDPFLSNVSIIDIHASALFNSLAVEHL